MTGKCVVLLCSRKYTLSLTGFLTVKGCGALNVPSSNVTGLTGLTYGSVVYGACDTGWETTQGGSPHFLVNCMESGNWLPEYTCQSKKCLSLVES